MSVQNPETQETKTEEQKEKDFLESIKASQDFTQSGAVKKLQFKIPFRKPDAGTFFRSHPTSEYSHRITTLCFKADGISEMFVLQGNVEAEVEAEFPHFIRKQWVHAIITKQGSIHLWPIPDPVRGKDNDYWSTAREIISTAKTEWVAIVSNQSAGCYDALRPIDAFPDPEWPDITFGKLLMLALKGKIIDKLDHEALLRLRGNNGGFE